MARPRAQDYEEKQTGILSEAAKLFARYGFTGSSINMIAEACGMSKALLYHYYPDKDSILFAVLQQHLAELVGAVEAAAAEAKTPEARVLAIASSLLDSYKNADAEHQVQISSLKLLPPDKQATLVEMERRLVVLLSNALAECLPHLHESANLKPLTMSMFGMLNWHYLWFREDKGLSRDEYAKMVTTLILSGSKDL
ncbi:TetR/AcrR family transcriptional regulator [Bartonella sp. LJL80]